jgi:plasmid stability protein
MPSLTIKGIPDRLVRRLKKRAIANRRSLNSEVIRCLEQAAGRDRRGHAGREHLVDSGRVLRLIDASPCSAHDCEFVARADQLGVPLVTSDRKILRSFPTVAVAPASFAGGA